MYRLISSKTVMAKLFRDLRLTDSRYVSDMLEWFGEAMGYLKVFPALHRKVAELDIQMHRAELPVDLIKIQQVLKLPGDEVMSYNSTTFPKSLHTRDCPNQFSFRKAGYIINFNYIETDFEEGKIALSYLAAPRDEDDYPMVPDDSALLEALKWYVSLRMVEGGWKHPAGMQYPDVEARWFHYCAQARQRNKMPDIDQYQNFLESWVRLVPDYTRHAHVFDKTFKSQEDVVNAQGIIIRGVDQVSQFSDGVEQVEGFDADVIDDD